MCLVNCKRLLSGKWRYPKLVAPGLQEPIVNALYENPLYEEVEKAVSKAYRLRVIG